MLDARRLESEASPTIISPLMQPKQAHPFELLAHLALLRPLLRMCGSLAPGISNCLLPVCLLHSNFSMSTVDQLLIARYSRLPAFVRAWQRGSERSSYRPVGDHMESKAHEMSRSCTEKCSAPVVGRVPRDSIQSREHHARHYIT